MACRADIGVGHPFQRAAGQAAGGLDRLPRGLAQILGEGLEAVGVGGDEIAVQHVLAGVGAGDDGLHDALQRRGVAADLDLVIGRGDRGGAEARHLDRVLRIGEALQRPLLQRVEHDDRHAAARAFVQRAHHARMVGAGIVAHRDDQVAMVEILQRDRALADADRLRQPDAGRLVAHVGAVGEVVGAVFAGEDVEQERRLVRGPAGGVELRHVGVGQAAQHFADPGEGGVPFERPVGVARRVIGHRMGDAAVVLQLVIALLEQFRDGVLRRRIPA